MADRASTSNRDDKSGFSSALASSSAEPNSSTSTDRKVKRKPKTAFDRQRRRPLRIYSLDHHIPYGRSEATPQSECVFRFLELAPELRNRIYNYALQGESASWTGRTRYNYSDWKEPYRTASLYCPRGANVSLMRCCKQIYQETKALIYELNIFNLAVKMLPSLQTIVTLKQPSKAWACWKRIKHLQIQGSVASIPKFVAPLVSRRDLEIHTLRLDLSDGNAEDMMQLGQLQVHGSVKITMRRPSTMDQGVFVSQLKSLLEEVMRKFFHIVEIQLTSNDSVHQS